MIPRYFFRWIGHKFHKQKTHRHDNSLWWILVNIIIQYSRPKYVRKLISLGCEIPWWQNPQTLHIGEACQPMAEKNKLPTTARAVTILCLKGVTIWNRFSFSICQHFESSLNHGHLYTLRISVIRRNTSQSFNINFFDTYVPYQVYFYDFP